MQGFIKTEFSTLMNDHVPSAYTNASSLSKEKCSTATNMGFVGGGGSSLICRKKLDFEATNQMRHKTSTPKKNTAIVAGTVQSHNSKNHEHMNSVCFNEPKPHRSATTSSSSSSQYPKMPSNTKRNARERNASAP